MKTLLAIALFLASSFAWAAPKVDPTEYNVNVHVTASHWEAEAYGASPHIQGTQILKVLIGGTKYELAATPVSISITKEALMMPGDYKARLVTDKRKSTYAYLREYELLFPDGTTKKFTVVGQSE